MPRFLKDSFTMAANAVTGGASRGIVYVATGKRYVEEAIASATSCREYMPQLPIHLFTDTRIEHKVFSSVALLSNVMHSAADKILPLVDSPFDRTVFLDTDTKVCGEFPEVFDLLDNFDLAAAHAPWRTAYQTSKLLLPPQEQTRIPAAFPELNTGFMAFKKNAATEQLFREWHARYMASLNAGEKPPHDQPALRAVLYHSACRYFVLPPEYNCRFNVPTSVSGHVKVIHGRRGELNQVSQIINADDAPRVYIHGRLYRRIGRDTVLLDQAELFDPPRPFLGRSDWRRPLLSLAAIRLRKKLRSRVHAGPFAGMQFHRDITGMTYYPKLLGTYEMELQSVIEDISRTPFARVVNAGAGDGYFAIGLARMLPQASVVAFEANPKRQALIQSLAACNDVADRVSVAGACDVSQLSAALGDHTPSLIFMDVEGAEDELLNPKLAPQLGSATIAVEIHDKARPGIGSLLAERFAATHTLLEILARPRRTVDFPLKNAQSAPLFANRDICLTLMTENRPLGMRWFYLRPAGNNPR